jgi:hypothetical protein
MLWKASILEEKVGLGHYKGSKVKALPHKSLKIS